MIFTQAELQSSTWLKLKEYLEAELAERRAFNDGHSLTEVETATVRGEIKHIKRTLNLEVMDGRSNHR